MIREFECPLYIELPHVQLQEKENICYYRWNKKDKWREIELGRTMQQQIDWYITSGWTEVTSTYDPNDLFPCCKGPQGIGPYFHVGGKLHEAACIEVSQQSFIPSVPPAGSIYTHLPLENLIEQPKNLARCTCGSTAVGSDKHSYYCDIK